MAEGSALTAEFLTLNPVPFSKSQMFGHCEGVGG